MEISPYFKNMRLSYNHLSQNRTRAFNPLLIHQRRTDPKTQIKHMIGKDYEERT